MMTDLLITCITLGSQYLLAIPIQRHLRRAHPGGPGIGLIWVPFLGWLIVLLAISGFLIELADGRHKSPECKPREPRETGESREVS
jgi:hypothetical protein